MPSKLKLINHVGQWDSKAPSETQRELRFFQLRERDMTIAQTLEAMRFTLLPNAKTVGRDRKENDFPYLQVTGRSGYSTLCRSS